jgi:GAF domain-containing protein
MIQPAERPPQSAGGKLELASVMEMARHLSSILDLNTLLEKIMDISIEVTGAERCCLFLSPDQGEQKLEAQATRNTGGAPLAVTDFAFSRNFVGKVEKSREAWLVADAAAEKTLQYEPSVTKQGLRSVLCAPLIARDNMIGAVYLDNRTTGGLFTGEKLEVLRILLAQAAISIENAKATKELQKTYDKLQQYANMLEEKVKERTSELQEKMTQLEEFNQLAAGRELKVTELEKESDELRREMGRQAKYR